VTLVDSGELILAAKTLGVAHPPGFPLYVLLTHAFTWLPLGSVAARVNFASALFAALAAAVLPLVVAEMSLAFDVMALIKDKAQRADRKTKKPAAKDERREESASRTEQLILTVAPCTLAGLLFAFSRTLWAYATIAEVYTLNALLISLIFFLMFGWRRRILEERVKSGKVGSGGSIASPYDRWLYGAAFVFGLAMGVHHVSVAVTLPAFAVLVLATEGIRFFWSMRLLKAALFAFVGLAIYLYLPLAAMRSPLMNWGDPRTLERIWWHVTGKQYQEFLNLSSDVVGRQLKEFFSLVGHEFNFVWLPVGILIGVPGFVAIFKRDRATFWAFMLVVICDLAWALNYEIAEDKDAYYLPTFLTLALATGCGALWLIRQLRQARLPVRVVTGIALAVSLLIPTVALASNYGFNNRHHYLIARDYVENILNTVESKGLLLTQDWQVYSPLLYLREVEGVRKDVRAIDLLQLRRSWYYDYLGRVYPEIMAASHDKVDAFLEDLRHFERDNQLYERDLMLNQRINTRFYDMLESFVTEQMRNGPVYITIDVATNGQGENHELTDWLKKTYDFLPHGIVFQLKEKGGFTEPIEPTLQTRGLNDGSFEFADNDVVKLKVLPVYEAMLTNRGLYLAAYGHPDRAIAAFKEALAIDPNYKPAVQGLNDSLRASHKNESGK
jgi:tetratricopeptide (TPR) repeat protein